MRLLRLLPLLVLVYFSWHAFSGNRSIPRAVTLARQIEQLETQVSELRAKAEVLDAKVVALREESLDLDILDTQTRAMLGLARQGELHLTLCGADETQCQTNLSSTKALPDALPQSSPDASLKASPIPDAD